MSKGLSCQLTKQLKSYSNEKGRGREEEEEWPADNSTKTTTNKRKKMRERSGGGGKRKAAMVSIGWRDNSFHCCTLQRDGWMMDRRCATGRTLGQNNASDSKIPQIPKSNTYFGFPGQTLTDLFLWPRSWPGSPFGEKVQRRIKCIH